MLLVVLSAAGFGFALFGHRPVPQPATPSTAGHPTVGLTAEPSPRLAAAGTAAAPTPTGPAGLLQVGWLRRVLQREPSASHQPSGDAALSPWIRLRSALVLMIVVGGIAALVGIIASVILVAAVMLLT